MAAILAKVAKMVAPGVSTEELDAYAYKLIKEGGDEPAFLNYKPEGQAKAFPASLCTSVNNEVVHGIPNKEKILKEGDIISIDLGIKHKGLFTDHAITVPVGKINKTSQKLLEVTHEALLVGIEEAKGGNTVGDIGHAIEKFVGHKYGIVRELSGHGVGKKMLLAKKLRGAPNAERQKDTAFIQIHSMEPGQQSIPMRLQFIQQGSPNRRVLDLIG